MKSLNFKRKENAQLRYLEEKVKGTARSRYNWDRIVYLTILGLIVFFVLRYFFLHSFYITADGQVLFESVEIGETQDVRIERFFIEEGDNMKVGDTLFTYLIQDPNEFALKNNDSESKSNWAEREIYALQKSIQLNNSQIAGDEKLMNSYKSQLKRLENEVILGAATERDLNNLEYQISKLETNISLLQSENEVMNKQIYDLMNNKTAVQEKQKEPATFSPYRAFVSPIEGYVARIFKEPYEVALKSQIIMKVHRADSVHIKGYFDQEDLKYVEVGDCVDVTFPDGKESEGMIKRFYTSTVLIPEEFQEKYEPTKRTIAVDIVPAPGADLTIWKRYYKLSVKLRKSTF